MVSPHIHSNVHTHVIPRPDAEVTPHCDAGQNSLVSPLQGPASSAG